MELTLGKNHILEGNGYLLGAEYECGCEQLKINLTYDLLLDKWAYLEFITSDGEKFTTPRLTNENGQVSYTVPSGLLKEGYVKIQAVFRDANGFVWKSLQRQFLVDKSINATEEYPEAGADWLSQAQATLDAITIESDKVDAVLESEEKRAQEAQLIAAAEATRVENETARKNNETARVEAEALRAQNETSRATAETARAATEQARVTAENARVTAENTRSTQEQTRQDQEQARVEAETLRASYEQSRKNSEMSRANAETARATAETARATNESARVTAENARARSESDRASAETLRAIAEQTRSNNETARSTNEANRQKAETERVNNETARVDWLSQAQTTLDAITIESDKVDAVLESEEKRAQEAQLIAAAEATRVENETARKNNETARVEAEALRAQNETSRATAETARAATEQTRQTQEQAREEAEALRVDAEEARKQNETAREEAEAARATNETARASTEQARATAESTRVNAENARANAEALRATAENARVNAENARASDEQTRQTNELARQSAEQARREEFNGWAENIGNLTSCDKRLINLEAAGVGTLFETQVKTGVGYRVTVPTNALPYATIHKLGGKSIITNNVFNYYELINVDTKITGGSFNVTSNGNTILTNEWVLNNLKPNTPYNIGITFWRQLRDTTGYTNVSYKKGVALVNNSTGAVVDMLFNNEDTGDEAVENKGTFTTPADLTNYVVVAYTELWADTNGVESAVQFRFANMYISETDTEYLPYDASGIVNADVNQISTRNVYQIPQAVRELDGYGIGIDDTNYNYIDFDRKVFVKNVEVVDKELTVLATPVETDISANITDNYINVNNASNVVFNSLYQNAVPYEITFTVKL